MPTVGRPVERHEISTFNQYCRLCNGYYRDGVSKERHDELYHEKVKMPPVQSVEETLAERGSRYGKFADHARIAQQLQNVMRGNQIGGDTNWYMLPADSAQALTVIADKIARILNGDPEYHDNWRDIAGYATLVLNRITGEQNGTVSQG